jgi:hypothetical protein
MVWLNRSPIPVGTRGVISLFKLFLSCLPSRRVRGGGRHPVGTYSYRETIGEVLRTDSEEILGEEEAEAPPPLQAHQPPLQHRGEAGQHTHRIDHLQHTH